MEKPVSKDRTVKVSSEVHQQLLQLIDDINEKGWQHLGISRRDTPTVNSLIEEGLIRLRKKKQ